MPTGQLELTPQELSGCNPIITLQGNILRGSGVNSISQFSKSGQILDTAKGRSKTVESVTFLDNHSLVYGSGDNAVHILDFNSGHSMIVFLSSNYHKERN